MSLIKLGESVIVSSENIHKTKSILADKDILEKFKKVAASLNAIAPKAKDFLYFSAIMMHSAEASLLDDNGKIRKDAAGNDVTASWEKKGESVKWKCSDSSIKPLKNNNGDIFPEAELVKAHKKWVGRPLCLDHKSDSVDMVRGIIVDTFYDYSRKCVIALCALDKVNYPDLARKVSTRYATSVSMGTAVGRAVCTDCGTVARVESDFCSCMRNKTCWGEVNLDLSPMELSIVVNGADPAAQIRHIVAASNSLARYIDAKQVQLSKIAQDETHDIELAAKIESGLEKAINDFTELKELISKLKGNEEAEQENYEKSLLEDDEDKGEEQDEDDTDDGEDENDINDQNSDENDEDNENSLDPKQAFSVLEGIKKSLASLTEEFNKFVIKSDKETKMKKKNAYFQSGGGVNEPTPGKPRYDKEDSDSIRNTKDTQMTGLYDMGPVDGMAGGAAEVAKKKELQRLAEKEKRAIRRDAALEKAKEKLAASKQAYYQGGGGVNEPTPGKPKYPKEDAEGVRNKEDKQMAGKKPFPDVGDPMGLFPGDKELKEKLKRANLKARFIKAYYPNGQEKLADSCWQITADNKMIISATVDEITGGRTETLGKSVATKDFGQKVLSTLRTEGFNRVASLFKGAQAAPAPAPVAPAVPAPAPQAAGPAPMGDFGGDASFDPSLGADPVDAGGSGDVGSQKDNVMSTLNLLENNIADLRRGVEAIVGQSGNELDDLGGEGELPTGDLEDPSVLPPSVAALLPLREKLGNNIVSDMRKIIANMKESHEELSIAREIYSGSRKVSSKQMARVHVIAKDACATGRGHVKEAYESMDAYVNYAKGTEALIRKARAEKAKMSKKAKSLSRFAEDGVDVGDTSAAKSRKLPEHKMNRSLEDSLRGAVRDGSKQPDSKSNRVKNDPGSYADSNNSDDGIDVGDTSAAKSRKLPEHKMDRDLEDSLRGAVRDGSRQPDSKSNRVKADPGSYTDENDAKVKKPDGTEITLEGDEVSKALSSSAARSTKSGRAELRAKLAEKGVSFSDMIQKAHPKGGFTSQNLSGDLAKVETITETHSKMLDVANAPPRVRKAAEQIQEAIVSGKLSANDVPKLVSNGVDADAVKYWKQYYGAAKDGGGEFASELLKEHSATKLAEEKEAYKVKVSRAYALAQNMASVGMISADSRAITAQAEEIMTFNDNAFDSIKRQTERYGTVKTASFPQVGLLGGNDLIVPEPPKANAGTDYNLLFVGKKY